MRVAALSDLHGNLPVVPECDLLLVAGDVTPVVSHDLTFQRCWLEDQFTDWLESAPAEAIVGVAGNHDFIAQSHPEVMRRLPWTYLNGETTTLLGMRVHGSPWVPTFFDWAFMKDDDYLGDHWALIPDDVDILVTHGPPRGICDMNHRGEQCGSRTLRKRVDQLASLKLHVFGHIHSGRGVHGKFSNVAIVSESYDPVNPVAEFVI